MPNRIKRYFACGNTAQGFIDYSASNLQGLDKIFILQGGPGTEKSYLIKSLCTVCDWENLDYECMHNPLEPELLDGIVIPQLKAAVVDGTAPHLFEPSAPGAVEEYISLGGAWNTLKLKTQRDTLAQTKGLVEQAYKNAGVCFAEAMRIHDEWEKIYIKNMDFSQADKLMQETIENVLGGSSASKAPIQKHRFFGASTFSGSFDHVSNLISGVGKRYYLKGRPGTGKSTLLKKLASVSAARGLDAELYHCGFDANSLDMVQLPELDVCIFDCTPPHLYAPDRFDDTVVDMYAGCVKPGTDERYEREIQGISARYQMAIRRGTGYLAEVKRLTDGLKEIYAEATDYAVIDALKNEIAGKMQPAAV
jgi:hypothetical protein